MIILHKVPVNSNDTFTSYLISACRSRCLLVLFDRDGILLESDVYSCYRPQAKGNDRMAAISCAVAIICATLLVWLKNDIYSELQIRRLKA